MFSAMMGDIVREPHGLSLYADWLEDQGREAEAARYRHRSERVDRLEEWQRGLLPAWRDYWLAAGLRTSSAPLDTGAAKAAVGEVYREAGLPPPVLVVTVDSPLAGAMAAALLCGAMPGAADEQVWQDVSQQLRQQVWQQVRQQVGQQVRQQVEEQLEQQLGQQLGQQVRQQLGQQLEERLWQQVWQQVWRAGYGLHDAGWLCLYSFLYSVVGLQSCRRMLPLIRLAHLAGWWWPLDGAVVVTPPPSRLGWSGKKLTAFEYPDGFSWRAG
jgi:predicted Fe-S protein YdhL (DUF1289 family)